MTAILYSIWNYLSQVFGTKEKAKSPQRIDYLVKYKIPTPYQFHSSLIIPRHKCNPILYPYTFPILTKFDPTKNNTIWPSPTYYQFVALKNKPHKYPFFPSLYFPLHPNRWMDTKHRTSCVFPRVGLLLTTSFLKKTETPFQFLSPNPSKLLIEPSKPDPILTHQNDEDDVTDNHDANTLLQ